MERIANPVAGRVHGGWTPAPPPTRLMLVCRYGYALWVACGLLVGGATPDGASIVFWLAFPVWMIGSWILGAGANGSWWRSAPFDAWHLGVIILVVVFTVALGWGLLADDRLVPAFAATAMIGAVLGVGALQAWQSVQRRRP